MSDEVKYRSPDVEPTISQLKKWNKDRQPIHRYEIKEIKRYRRARDLAKRWEAEDPEVTMQDIVDALLGRKRETRPQ
jgi:hypothetical protein